MVKGVPAGLSGDTQGQGQVMLGAVSNGFSTHMRVRICMPQCKGPAAIRWTDLLTSLQESTYMHIELLLVRCDKVVGRSGEHLLCKGRSTGLCQSVTLDAANRQHHTVPNK